MTSSDLFWVHNPKILFANNNYCKVLVNRNMTRIEILNLFTRIFFYLLIAFIVLGASAKYILIPIVGIIIILILYYVNSGKKSGMNEGFNDITEPVNIICTLPTRTNPFMNITMQDWIEDPTRPAACFATPEIKANINEKLQRDLMLNPDNIINTEYGQRQFYTTPSTTIPNDQTAFAMWTYGPPSICKEDSAFCLKYEDPRFQITNPELDNLNNLIL